MKRTVFLLPLVLLIGMTSCATIITGSKESVTINTNPPGAEVSIIRGGATTQTVVAPATVELKKGKPYTFQATLDGMTGTGFIDTSFEPWFIGNIICGGIIGIIIDIATGAYMDLDQTSITIDLKPAS